MNKDKLIIATRESALALWQSHYVKSMIEKAFPELSCQLLKLKTEGDRILDRPLNEIGGKALFMKSLETAMLEKRADIAVHSLKDVPYALPEGFTLAAFSPRENPQDAFVSNRYASLDQLPKGAKIGTSSLRRKAQLLAYRPDLIIESLRGNVNTRLQKLDRGDYDAIILAAAGLIRLGLKARIKQYIATDICLPSAGQGVVVIECLKKETALIERLSRLNNKKSRQCVEAERAFNQRLQGGCHVPIAAYGEIQSDLITLSAMVASPDGKRLLKDEAVAALSERSPKDVGVMLAEKMIAQGARQILALSNKERP